MAARTSVKILTRGSDKDIHSEELPIFSHFLNEVSVHFDMPSAIMLDMVMSRTKRGFIITEKVNWMIPPQLHVLLVDF